MKIRQIKCTVNRDRNASKYFYSIELCEFVVDRGM